MEDISAHKLQKTSTDDKQGYAFVLKFLSEHNLTETANLFKKEIKDGVSDITVASEKPPVTNPMLSQYVRKPIQINNDSDVPLEPGHPLMYREHYLTIINFVNKSLDVHKSELSVVLYPVFVQMYIQLVANGHSVEAVKFFEEFSDQQEPYYQKDIRMLQAVLRPEHIPDNKIIENYKSEKFTIKMSRDSYNHLKRTLNIPDLKLILDIVHDHLFIDIFDGIPQSDYQVTSTCGGLLGHASIEANKPKVLYGLLKEPDLQVTAIEEGDKEEVTDGDDTTPVKKKKKKKDLMVTKKMKADPNSPSINKIPLPELHDLIKNDKVRALRESVKRLSVSPDQLPSIICYTLLNTYDGATTIEICDDSTLLAIGFADSSIRVYSLNDTKLKRMKSGELLESLDPSAVEADRNLMYDDRTATDMKILRGHTNQITSISFAPDKTLLVSGSIDTTIRLWSTDMWTCLVCYRGHLFPVWDVKFSPHGYYFASGGHDVVARLWATDHHTPLRFFVGHVSDVEAVRFHPNSNYVATGSADKSIRLFDVSNGALVRMMNGHKDSILILLFSHCGRYLFSAGVDRSILVWDISNGDLAGYLSGHKANIYSLSLSRDSTVLCSGGGDNTVILWDYKRLIQIAPKKANCSSCLISCYGTKRTPVQLVHFTRRNMVVVSGAYVGEAKSQTL